LFKSEKGRASEGNVNVSSEAGQLIDLSLESTSPVMGRTEMLPETS